MTNLYKEILIIGALIKVQNLEKDFQIVYKE
jgi:hypothetical protein